jgi:hypothetical protein
LRVAFYGHKAVLERATPEEVAGFYLAIADGPLEEVLVEYKAGQRHVVQLKHKSLRRIASRTWLDSDEVACGYMRLLQVDIGCMGSRFL